MLIDDYIIYTWQWHQLSHMYRKLFLHHNLLRTPSSPLLCHLHLPRRRNITRVSFAFANSTLGSLSADGAEASILFYCLQKKFSRFIKDPCWEGQSPPGHTSSLYTNVWLISDWPERAEGPIGWGRDGGSIRRTFSVKIIKTLPDGVDAFWSPWPAAPVRAPEEDVKNTHILFQSPRK